MNSDVLQGVARMVSALAFGNPADINAHLRANIPPIPRRLHAMLALHRLAYGSLARRDDLLEPGHSLGHLLDETIDRDMLPATVLIHLRHVLIAWVTENHERPAVFHQPRQVSFRAGDAITHHPHLAASNPECKDPREESTKGLLKLVLRLLRRGVPYPSVQFKTGIRQRLAQLHRLVMSDQDLPLPLGRRPSLRTAHAKHRLQDEVDHGLLPARPVGRDRLDYLMGAPVTLEQGDLGAANRGGDLRRLLEVVMKGARS